MLITTDVYGLQTGHSQYNKDIKTNKLKKCASNDSHYSHNVHTKAPAMCVYLFLCLCCTDCPPAVYVFIVLTVPGVPRQSELCVCVFGLF